MKSIYILITLLTISLNSFCQDTTYEFDDVSEKGAVGFIANKTKFRIHLIDATTATCSIEKFNNKWIIVDTIDEGYRQFYLDDINKDGFKDLVLTAKWQKEVYFFNPIKKTFIHTGSFSCGEEEMILLDSIENIYYDYQPYRKGVWASYLFKIKNYKRIELGVINVEAEFDEKLEDYVPNDITISKNTENINKHITIEKPKPNPKKQFNYASYWKLNWRKFLPK